MRVQRNGSDLFKPRMVRMREQSRDENILSKEQEYDAPCIVWWNEGSWECFWSNMAESSKSKVEETSNISANVRFKLPILQPSTSVSNLVRSTQTNRRVEEASFNQPIACKQNMDRR